MKKIILGLFLTAGMSTFAFAKNDINSKLLLKKDFLKVAECSTSTITSYVDYNGNLIKSVQSAWTTIDCGGQPDGTKVIHTTVVQVPKILSPF